MVKLQISTVASLIGAVASEIHKDVLITRVIDLMNDEPMGPDALFWCNDKNVELLKFLTSGTVILSEHAKSCLENDRLNYLIVANPRQAFQKVLKAYFIKLPSYGMISPSAFIDSSVIISKEVNIGHNVVIEEDCVIGSRVIIGHNSVIKSGTIIGDDVTIGSNNTIGGVGFGYEKNTEGNWELMPHIGNVVISKGVEIGNNTCIDRAVLGSTFIGENVKIDNLVHVAHGVKIEENALIIANAMLGGSARIGSGVWFGPSASILNKGVVEDGALIGMSAVVVKPVEENAVMAGNPAKMLRKNS